MVERYGQKTIKMEKEQHFPSFFLLIISENMVYFMDKKISNILK
jgi:hypothetical protein